MQRRLYRSVRERMLGGVCGGIADYLGTDPT
ncbi:MAG TPA: PspC domain-containing protein, partial [Bacillota bacterium]|nr:PspC domain-containing protein [Bacillota bacterium]